MTIAERWDELKRRPSGFDYMRIALSVAILLWHSYGLTYGDSAAAYIMTQTPLGVLLKMILPTFFALSGFLVSSSMSRNKVFTFLGLRAIRIFPALAVEITLSVFILGPLVTRLPLTDYFMNRNIFSYMANIVGWFHYMLPGVFLDNPIPKLVNPSLWTIPYELECYILISVLASIKMFSRKWMVIPLFFATVGVVMAYYIVSGENPAPPTITGGRILVLCFFAGIVIYSYKDVLPWRLDIALASFLISACCVRSSHLIYVVPLAAAYMTVYLGLLNPPRSIVINAGDYSYGTYLYAGPIQQTIAYVLGASGTWALNVSIALPTTVMFALFSWHYVEKPFLKVRRFIEAKPAPRPIEVSANPALDDPRVEAASQN